MLVFPDLCFSQQEGPQFTRQSIGLKANVKEIISKTYSIRENGQNRQIIPLYGYRYTYYKSGFIDSSFSADMYDSTNWVLNYHYYFKLDTFFSTVHRDNAWSKVLFNRKQAPVYMHFFWEKSNVQEVETIYEYDTSGRIVRIAGKNDPPGMGLRYSYKRYNDTSFIQRRTDIADPDYRIFNTRNMLVFYTYFNNTKLVKTEIKYFYNAEGDIVKEKEMMYRKEGERWGPIDKNGTTWEYQYVYDNNNNWLSRTKSYNGKQTQLETRKIFYWE
ncbi:MAG TPA: hypothetical protein PKD42_03795 [Chitinophagaceae bacterium]|nr:hypothetical protein [Chitinophagaceae bacterium]